MRNAGVLPFKCRETIAGSLHCVGMDFFRIISYTSDYLVQLVYQKQGQSAHGSITVPMDFRNNIFFHRKVVLNEYGIENV